MSLKIQTFKWMNLYTYIIVMNCTDHVSTDKGSFLLKLCLYFFAAADISFSMSLCNHSSFVCATDPEDGGRNPCLVLFKRKVVFGFSLRYCL